MRNHTRLDMQSPKSLGLVKYCLLAAISALIALGGCGKSLPPGQSEYAQGLDALYSGDTTAANELFLKAEQADQTRPWRLLGKGKFYETYMTPFESMVYYWRAIQSAPDFDSAYVRYCNVALSYGKRELALLMADRFAERFNFSADLSSTPTKIELEYQLILAEIESLADEGARAESRLSRLADAFPNSARVMFKLAEELYRSGKVDAADKMLGDARDKLSDSRADFETAVMSYVVCNRPDEAVALLADMRDEYDNDMNARRVAFDTYLQLGYMDHADQLVYSLRDDGFPEYAFWYYRGQLSEAGGEFQIACRMYEYAITFEKTCMSIYRDLARTMAGLNNFALMEDHMQNVLYYTEDQGYPEEVFDETRLMFAEYYAQTRQWGPALGQIAEARKRFAGTARLELLDASVRGYMLQTDSAKEHMERFAIAARPSVANYQGLARVWGQLSNLDSAEHYLKKALELDPADIGMRLTQSQIQLQKGDSATYQKALQEMHVQFPGDKRVTRALAGWFAGKGDLTSALDLANQLIDTYPGDLSTYKLAARTATSRYGVEQGREYYRKAISNNPNLPAAQHMLALDFISNGQSDSASVHLDKALKILPLYEPARLARGVIFESRQSPDSAIAIYTQIIKENPFNADAYNNLAWVLASNGLELPRSSNLAREAIHLSGGRRANMHGTLGWTYYRQDQFQRASGSYSMAIQLQPDDPFKHYLAGVNFADWGKLDEARAQLDTALALGLTPQYSSNLKVKLDSASSN